MKISLICSPIRLSWNTWRTQIHCTTNDLITEIKQTIGWDHSDRHMKKIGIMWNFFHIQSSDIFLKRIFRHRYVKNTMDLFFFNNEWQSQFIEIKTFDVVIHNSICSSYFWSLCKIWFRRLSYSSVDLFDIEWANQKQHDDDDDDVSWISALMIHRSFKHDKIVFWRQDIFSVSWRKASMMCICLIAKRHDIDNKRKSLITMRKDICHDPLNKSSNGRNVQKWTMMKNESTFDTSQL